MKADAALDRDYDEGIAKLPGGGELAYQVHGREHGGTPILLLRPLGGAMALWGNFRAELAQQLRVIAFDLRGTGRSSADPAWATTKSFARDGLEVLRHLGVSRSHVFGISLGGMAATWLAILEPARVARLCLASTAARGVALGRTGLRRELALAACFGRRARDVEASVVERILSRGFRETHPDEVLRIQDVLHAAPASRMALLHHALAGFLHDAHRDLHRIEAPTLVLAGDNDRLFGTESLCELALGVHGATFEVIPNCGHDLTLEQPVVTAARVSQFFLS